MTDFDSFPRVALTQVGQNQGEINFPRKTTHSTPGVDVQNQEV